MSIRSPDRICPIIIAAVLLGISSLLDSGLAQDPSPKPSADAASSPANINIPGPTHLEPLPAGESVGVLGKKVFAPNGEDLGLITDVIVDRAGQPRAAVIDFGGFLGVGSRKVAVDWSLVSFDTEKRDRAAVLTLSRREIQAAPEYRADAAEAEMVGPPLVGPSSAGDVGK